MELDFSDPNGQLSEDSLAQIQRDIAGRSPTEPAMAGAATYQLADGGRLTITNGYNNPDVTNLDAIERGDVPTIAGTAPYSGADINLQHVIIAPEGTGASDHTYMIGNGLYQLSIANTHETNRLTVVANDPELVKVDGVRIVDISMKYPGEVVYAAGSFSDVINVTLGEQDEKSMLLRPITIHGIGGNGVEDRLTVDDRGSGHLQQAVAEAGDDKMAQIQAILDASNITLEGVELSDLDPNEVNLEALPDGRYQIELTQPSR